jgi:hypothetical protein
MDPMRADIDKICEILNRLGTRDSVSTMSSPGEPGIPGLQPAESTTLWESLRGVDYRFRELEQKVTDQTPEAALTKPRSDARQINTRTPDAHVTPAGTPPEETQQETTTRTVRYLIANSSSEGLPCCVERYLCCGGSCDQRRPLPEPDCNRGRRT